MATTLKLPENNLYSNGFIIQLDEERLLLKRDKGNYSYAVTRDKSHTVIDGQTIWDIAFQWYQNSRLWYIIADANKSIIRNPMELIPGVDLIIPEFDKFKLESK